jgi:hypothetical protein
LWRVCRVSIQMATPSPRVKMAQMMMSAPWARSQPRFVGKNRAGREMRKVIKTNIAFTTPAADGLAGVGSRFKHSCHG